MFKNFIEHPVCLKFIPESLIISGPICKDVAKTVSVTWALEYFDFVG